MNVTPTLNLHKPDINGEDTENVWGYDLNTNFDLIDAAFAGLAGDKGDVIVGANGSLTFDPNIVTAAARSVIAGPTITAMRTTLGAEATIPLGTTAQFWRGDKSWQTLGIADIPALQPALNLKAPLADPVFTGNPTAPTPAPGDNDTSIATTAFVGNALTAKAPLVSPAFTGNPTAPTPIAGDNDTSIATTAFVTSAIVAGGSAPLPSNATPKMAGVAASGTSVLYTREDHVHPSDTSRVAKTGDTMSGPLSGVTTLSVASLFSSGNVQASGTIIGDTVTTVLASATTKGTVTFGTGGQYVHYNGASFLSSAPWDFSGKAVSGITTLTTTGAGTFGGAVTANAGLVVSGATTLNGLTTLSAGNGIQFNNASNNFAATLTNAGASNQNDIYLNAGMRFNGMLTGITTLAVSGGATFSGGISSSGTYFATNGAMISLVNAAGNSSFGLSNSGATGASLLLCGAGAAFGGAVSTAALTVTGTGTFSGSGTFGDGSALTQVSANGNNSGTAGGSSFVVRNSGTVIFAIGNQSGIVGGVYSATPYVLTSADITFNHGAMFAGPLSGIATLSTGAVSCNTGVGALPAITAAVRVAHAGGGSEYGLAFRPVTDSTTAILFQNAAATQVGSITQGPTAVAYNATSDGRLKEDLRDIDSGSFFDRVKVYDFAWKADGSRGVGCIAQELNEIAPSAVAIGQTMIIAATDDEPEHEIEMPWGVDYSKLVPHLIAEVQALRARVAHLEAA